MSNFRAAQEEIAIVGIGCRFPDADNYIQFWNNLKSGKNAITDIISRTMTIDGTEYQVGRWDEKFYSADINKTNTSNSRWCGLIDRIDEFDNQFFNISPREAKNMDPQQRLLLQETWHCIEDSGIPLHDLQTKKTGVLVGVMTSDYHQEISNEEIIIDSYAGLGNYDCILANRISYHFGFTGISMATDAACASSLVAIHQGRNSLLNYESDYILAGGVALNSHPWKYISFSKSRMLSPDGQCKTFDKSANGYVPGEGVAMILMQRMEDAKASGNHIYGVIKGSHVNHCGFSRSITAPNIDAQEDLIKRTFDSAQVRPSSISYVEAHGTGTSLGDPIEIEALSKAFQNYIPSIIAKEEFEKEIISWIESGKTRDFVKDCFYELPDQRRKLKDLSQQKHEHLTQILRDIQYISNNKQYCKIGSLKTNLGHLEACAGIAGVIKVLMMMKYRQIPPTLNITTPNPIVNWENTPFTIAGFKKGLSRFTQAVAKEIGVKNIDPVIFNASTLNELSKSLLDTYPHEISLSLKAPVEKSLYRILKEIARKELKVDTKVLNKGEPLYKTSEHWYPPEINLLVELIKFKYGIPMVNEGLEHSFTSIVNDEIIHSLSIDDIADLLVSIQKRGLEEFYADGEVVPDYKLVQHIISDLVEAVSEIFNISSDDVDISKNIGTFQKSPLRASVSSFGFGGVNSHIILEEFPQIYKEKQEEYPFNLFLLSAKTVESLERMRRSWQSYKRSDAFQKFSLRDICSNLMVGREQFPYRLGFVLSDKKHFSNELETAQICIADNSKLISLRVGCIEWSGFSQFKTLVKEIPFFLKHLEEMQVILAKLNIYKTVRDGMFQNTWSPKYRKLYSFLLNINCIKTLERLGLKIDLIIPDRYGAILALVITNMIPIEKAILFYEQQLKIEDIDVTIPSIPIINPVTKTVIPPFSFDSHYLKKLIEGLSKSDKDLDNLYIDTLLESKSNDHSVRLGTIFKREGLISEEEMQEYLKIHEKTGFNIEDILREKKRKISPETIAECLQENELLSFYVDDIIHVDTARQLNENQYTFKGYIDEWNRKLTASHNLDITQILEKESRQSPSQKEATKEKELLLIIISSSLQKLNDRWKIKRKQRSQRNEFNEIIDLLCDNVLTKEDCISLLLDKTPNFKAIAKRLQSNQFKCDPQKAYTLIKNVSNGKLPFVTGYELKEWVHEADKIGVVLSNLYSMQSNIIDKYINDFHCISFGTEPSSHDSSLINGSDLIESEIKSCLLHFWSKGYNLKWHKIIREGSYNRLALPLYKFEKRSFWLHGEKFNHDLSQDHSNKGIIHRFIKNEPIPPKSASKNNVLKEQYYLFKPQWTHEELEHSASTQPVIVISPKVPENWHPNISCVSVEDFERKLNNAKKSTPYTLLYYWNRNESLALKKALDDIHAILKSIAIKHFTCINQLIFYTDYNSKILPTLSPIMRGMFSSFRKESPQVKCKHIEATSLLSYKQIISESSEPTWHYEIQYNNNSRLVRVNDELVTPEQLSNIKEGAVYIIAGGSGKLGIKLAETLLKKCKCTVLSLGRRLETEDTKRLQEIFHTSEKLFRHYQWNPESISSATKLLTELIDTYGNIKGIINCTGIIGDSLLINKTVDSLQKVIAVKVGSTLSLHNATKKLQLDFFILFSSVVSDMGNIGQVDYAGANAFLNSFADYRNENGFYGTTLSLKLTLFAHGGMGLSDEAKKNFSIHENEHNPGVIESKDFFNYLISLWGMKGEITIATNPEYKHVYKSDKKVKKSNQSQDTEQFVRSLISEKCNIEANSINSDDALFSLGVGSLGIHELAAQLQKRFKHISPTTLFEYPNITSLVAHLDGHADNSYSNNKTFSPQPQDEELLSLLQSLYDGKISLEKSIDQMETLYE